MPQTIAFSLLTTLDCLSECRGTGEGEREDGTGEGEYCAGRAPATRTSQTPAV